MLPLFNFTEITHGRIFVITIFRFKNGVLENCSTLNIGEIMFNDLAIPLLLVRPREMSAYVHQKMYTIIFIEALFLIGKRWKQTKCPLTG